MSIDPLYRRWAGMKSRARPSFWLKSPAYTGVTIAPEFSKFAGFKEWATIQPGWDEQGWHLDKDILVRGNRIYGSDFCVFVPQEINALLPSNKVNRGQWPIGVGFGKDRRATFSIWLSIDGKNIRKSGFKTAEDAFAGYKLLKEENIRRAAQKYRGVIDSRAFDALMAYEVLITD